MPVFRYLWLLCVTMSVVMATESSSDEKQPEKTNDVVSVLVKEIRNLKGVVYAQGQQVRVLEGVVSGLGQEVQTLKGVVREQRATITGLRDVVAEQGEHIEALESGAKVRTETSDLFNETHNPIKESAIKGRPGVFRNQHHDHVTAASKTSAAKQGNTGKETSRIQHQDRVSTSHIPLQQGTNGKVSRGARAEVGVAFSAYLNHVVTNMSIGYVIKPEVTLLNDGNGYNTHTGIFTAPDSGVYMFIFFIHDYDKGEDAAIRLVVDDVHEVDAVIAPNNGNSVMGGNSAILRVNAGQAVWLQTYAWDDADLQTGDASRLVTFSGFLIY